MVSRRGNATDTWKVNYMLFFLSLSQNQHLKFSYSWADDLLTTLFQAALINYHSRENNIHQFYNIVILRVSSQFSWMFDWCIKMILSLLRKHLWEIYCSCFSHTKGLLSLRCFIIICKYDSYSISRNIKSEVKLSFRKIFILYLEQWQTRGFRIDIFIIWLEICTYYNSPTRRDG